MSSMDSPGHILRPYQERAIAEVYRHISAGKRRIVLVAPTGSGKTVLAARILRDAVVRRQRRALFLAHRDVLLHQAAEKLTAWGVPHGIVSGTRSSSMEAPVQVCSIQALDSPSTPLPPLGTDDLIIPDECHRANWKMINVLFPGRIIIGLTATPCVNRGASLLPLSDFEEMVVAATPDELRAQGFIVPAVIRAPDPPDLSVLEERASGDFAAAKLAAIMGDMRVVRGVVEDLAKMPRAKTAVFCVDVAHAKAVAAEIGAEAVAVWGSMGARLRDQAYARFAHNECSTIVSADLIMEGWDCPDLMRLVMLRPTRSLIVFLQQFGRGVRPVPGKERFELHDYAGNVMRFGDPFAPRPWSLDGAVLQGAKERGASIWRCANCFCVQIGGAPRSCPYCQRPVERPHERVELRDGKMVVYDEAEMERIARLRAEQEQSAAADRAQNNERIRKLFGVLKRRNQQRSMGALQPEVMRIFGRFKTSGQSWDDFFRSV